MEINALKNWLTKNRESSDKYSDSGIPFIIKSQTSLKLGIALKSERIFWKFLYFKGEDFMH